MIAQGRSNTRLRYRFTNLEQVRAHVHDVDGRALFFLRDDKLRFLPDAPVCISVALEEAGTPRLLHGQVVCAADGGGTWLELTDTRPLQAAPAAEARHSPRSGCDALVEARSERLTISGRMLDVSAGGARLAGIEGFAPGEQIELRLLNSDRLTFHDLSYARVAWTAKDQMGVQFDRSDIVGRHAVARLIAENETLWSSAWEGLHAPSCCAGQGVTDPVPPRPNHRAAAAQ